jgi:triosephosphate isomerase (TIM)
MSTKRKILIAGNWKMNKTIAESLELIQGLRSAVDNVSEVEMLVCPPFTALSEVSKALQGSAIRLGSQNVSEQDNGAFTGEISTDMLKELGVTDVILGHSERRQYYGETNALVATKALKVLAAGLKPVVCIGETLEEREAGKTVDVVTEQTRGSLSGISGEQMAQVVIAYEPVWAIGTGKTATSEQAQETHAAIRAVLKDLYGESVAEQTQILYGGSVKPGNAAELTNCLDIDGALVGGASLDASNFSQIIQNSIH